MVTQISLAEAAKTVKELPKTQQNTIKGGVLLVCEEKRHMTANGTFSTMTINAIANGEIGIMKMV